MQHTPDTFVEALGSGDADRVNAAIDEANDMDAEEQLRIFEECFDACTALYRDEDGYQRQSIVRFLHELHPRMELRSVGTSEGEDPFPGDLTRKDERASRSRLRDFLVEAIQDDDGRVRLAAERAIKELCLVYDLSGQEDELHSLKSRLESLASDHSGKKREHIERAIDDAESRMLPPGDRLRSALLDAMEESGDTQ
jgi:hypothetical protein